MAESLHAYIDESWDDKFFVLAAFLAPEEAWNAFSNDWAAALLEPPSIEYFKMKEVNGRREGQFTTFSGDERREKVLRLVTVINRHASADFSVSVPVESFNSLLGTTLTHDYRYPYLWLFNGMLTAISSYEFHTGPRRPIVFTFDEQRQFLPKSMTLYQRMKMLPPFSEHSAIVAKIEKGMDHINLPLQAADMLAGQVRLLFASPKPNVLNPILQHLKSTERFSYNHVFDAPQLLEMAHNIQKWSGRW